jgi:hypothetical protein
VPQPPATTGPQPDDDSSHYWTRGIKRSHRDLHNGVQTGTDGEAEDTNESVEGRDAMEVDEGGGK